MARAGVTLLTESDEEGIRSARRRRLEDEVILVDPEGCGVAALRGRDVSANGMFVYTPAGVPIGCEFVCQLSLDSASTVEVRGRVSRVVLDHDTPSRSGMGLRFTEITDAARSHLMAFTRPRLRAVASAPAP